MPITGPIPLPGNGMEEFLKQLQLGQQNRQNQARLDQQALANQKLNEYRAANLANQKQLQPLKLDLLKAKLKAAQHEGLPELTKANITNNQRIIQNVESLVPQIDALVESDFPGQTLGKYVHPSAQADYDSKIAELSDTLISALNLPKTDASLKLVDKMVRQKSFETRSDYMKRIDRLKEDLSSRKERATKYLTNKNVINFEDQDQGDNQNPDSQPPEQTEQNSSEMPEQIPGKSGATGLSNRLQLPSFNSKEEFQAWYRNQPDVVKHAVRLHLQGSK